MEFGDGGGAVLLIDGCIGSGENLLDGFDSLVNIMLLVLVYVSFAAQILEANH